MTNDELKVLKKIKNWTLLTYLRENRNWMVQSHFNRKDIEHIRGSKFTNSEWSNFTSFACDSCEYCKSDIMDAILYCWKSIQDEN